MFWWFNGLQDIKKCRTLDGEGTKCPHTLCCVLPAPLLASPAFPAVLTAFCKLLGGSGGWVGNNTFFLGFQASLNAVDVSPLPTSVFPDIKLFKAQQRQSLSSPQPTPASSHILQYSEHLSYEQKKKKKPISPCTKIQIPGMTQTIGK
ncbi:hypothetical protein EK904_005300 [Melospiza melodia maxima]|nr:hypothetical protein EK904_005300 [Melospiza melodia maxima]